MNKLNELIAVEWSFAQNSFHLTPLSHALTSNQKSLRNNTPTLYSILAIVDSDEEASLLIEEYRKLTKDRAAAETEEY